MTDYEDGRVTANHEEVRAAAEALRLYLATAVPKGGMDLTMKLGSGPQSGEAHQHRIDMVNHVLQSINSTRRGHAEHSIARHKDGRTAVRYYSAEAKRLRWLVTHHPTDGDVVVDAIDELTDGWQVVYNAPWPVRS